MYLCEPPNSVSQPVILKKYVLKKYTVTKLAFVHTNTFIYNSSP